MKVKALSVVKPFGDWIAEGSKTLEIRSWTTDQLQPGEDLLIVQNERYLLKEGDEDSDGEAVALVRVTEMRPFVLEDMAASRARSFSEGYFAWCLSDVRPLKERPQVLAARKIYELELRADLLQGLPPSHDGAPKPAKRTPPIEGGGASHSKRPL